ncbi:MAG: 1-acyl-sn-glycerol-3-phosphate acyltransferase [Candidatus Omnitrophica bacterium]|nr:1-acyl-sn-glycerol-3-phosphate acyltransferase [Candidatus Omnitrophota bacterium]
MIPLAYGLTKLLCWIFFRAGYGLQVSGQEHVPRRGAFLVASNHVSFLDPVVIGTACPRRLTFLARHTLFRHLLLRLWLQGVGAVPLNRDEADPSAIRSAIACLRRGQPVALFPEGTRQESGRLGAAKRGLGLLAKLGHVPVVPAYVRGTYEALPRNTTRLHRSKIRVAFGPPVAYTSTPVPPDAASGDPTARAQAEAKTSHADQQRIADAVTAAWRQLEARFAA